MGESKIVSSNSSPVNELYDKQVEMSQSLRGNSTLEEGKERKMEMNSDAYDGCSKRNQSLKGDSTLLEKKEERKLEMNLMEDSVDRIEGKEWKKEDVKDYE